MSIFRDFKGITRFTDLNGVPEISVIRARVADNFFPFESLHRKILKRKNIMLYWVDFLRILEKENNPQKENQHECSFCNRKFETELELITHKKEQHAVV